MLKDVLFLIELLVYLIKLEDEMGAGMYPIKSGEEPCLHQDRLG